MFAGNLLPIIFFLMLMMAGLMLAGWAAQLQALDPARSDINKHIQEAEAAMRPRNTPASSGSPALATEKELMLAQAQVHKAMHILGDLYRGDKITASQYEANKNKLQLLGIRVSVNSCFLMAQQALEREDTVRAMSFFRRAESLLNTRGVPVQEKQERLTYIDGERMRVLESSQGSGRPLLLAGSR